jgi:hypothetical protein
MQILIRCKAMILDEASVSHRLYNHPQQGSFVMAFD